MASYQRFEDLPVWQEASLLYNAVLDLFEDRTVPLSGSFRNQLERAALSVSNNIAEGFERVTNRDLLNFIAIAKGSAGEVRSMIAVVEQRPALKKHSAQLSRIRSHADYCVKQLVLWGKSQEEKFSSKRHLSPEEKRRREAAEKAKAFRLNFLKNLKPDHPLYNSPEGRAARGLPEYEE